MANENAQLVLDEMRAQEQRQVEDPKGLWELEGLSNYLNLFIA